MALIEKALDNGGPLDHEAGVLPVIIYAGTNERRLDFLENTFPHLQVLSQPGGSEDTTLDIASIARQKVAFVEGQPTLQSDASVVGSDAMISIGEDPQGDRLGKPSTEVDVQHLFQRLSETETFSYRISAGSFVSVATRGEKLQASGHESSLIQLRPTMVDWFGTDEGFAAYLAAFQEDNDVPQLSGQRLPKDITRGASGLDLGTLVIRGAVESIDGVSVAQTEEFRHALTKALYIGHAGFSGEVLSALGYSGILSDAANAWPWLHDYVDRIMASLEDTSMPEVDIQAPLLSVVIPVRDDPAMPKLLSTLAANTEFDTTDIVIVPNGAPAWMNELLETFQREHPNVQIVSTDPKGIAHARNVGIAAARGQWLIHLDSDVIVEPEFLGHVRETIEAHPGIEIILPKLLREPGRTRTQRLAARHFQIRAQRSHRPIHSPGLIVSREAHERYGTFSVSAHRDSEDCEFKWRADGARVVPIDDVILHRADDARKYFTQHVRYGRGKARILAEHPEYRVRAQAMRRQKRGELLLVPKMLKYRRQGLSVAVHESIIGFLSAYGFWSESLKIARERRRGGAHDPHYVSY